MMKQKHPRFSSLPRHIFLKKKKSKYGMDPVRGRLRTAMSVLGKICFETRLLSPILFDFIFFSGGRVETNAWTLFEGVLRLVSPL